MAGETILLAAPTTAPTAPIVAPSYWLLGVDDTIEIASICLASAFGVEVILRMLRPDGSIAVTVVTHQANFQLPWTTSTATPGAGVLLNATVRATSGSPAWAQLFLRIRVVHGSGNAQLVLGTLLQGYVTQRQDLAWPGSPLRASQDGPGHLVTYTLSGGGSGTELFNTVVPFARWRLIAFRCLLTTGAVAGTRFPALLIRDDAGKEVFRSGSPGSVPVSSAAFFNWAQGMPLVSNPSPQAYVAGLADGVMLRGGWHLDTTTGGLAVGDFWGQPTVCVEEWVDAEA